MRLGILGGTFDPVHLGHLHIAEQAYEQYELEKVLFIPTGQPAWKLDRAVTPASHRYAMLLKATADNPHFEVSRLEVDRPGITYTIDTLRSLKELFGAQTELCFIVGADAAAELDGWKDAAEIAQMVTILTAVRPGTVFRAQELSSLFDIRPIDTVPLDISASELRMLAAAGNSLRYLVPDPVRDYIAEQGLYLEAGL